MRFTISAAVASLFALSASAANITVMVGPAGSLVYTPANITAAVGDTVVFQFTNKNHTVTQSTFANPCQPMTSPVAGIDSGFLPIAAGATQFAEWSFTVDNASTPLWFSCMQTGHCQKGMVFSVNANADKTHDAFLANALASNTTGAPAAPGAPAPSGAPAGSPSVPVPAPSSSGAASPSGVKSAAGSSPSGTEDAAHSGAIRMSGSAAIILTAVGLVSGLVL